ncbi:MAG: hypothetical protein FJX19_07490, partial [Alphaproteobacteria bacterium]|nr:hypothetical protein [Alphaproteobacteria bacterium]
RSSTSSSDRARARGKAAAPAASDTYDIILLAALPRRALLRALLLAPLAASLGACGFRPLYAAGEQGGAGPAAPAAARDDLAATRVSVIPNREGQLLRRFLADRLNPGGAAGPRRYELAVGVRLSTEFLGIRRDNTPTRGRVIANAEWQLADMRGERPVAILSGRSRAVDAFNLIDQQFFASDLARDEATRRLMEQLSEEIALRLAVFFSRRREQGGGAEAAPAAPAPAPAPG